MTKKVGKSMGVDVKCFRADHIASSGIIHPEIWKALRTADFIICDVSGHNGNVMLELGVAAAWRRKEHVIILRDKNDFGYKIKVNNFDVSKKLTELPYVFSAGRVIFIAGYCHVGIRNIEVEEI